MNGSDRELSDSLSREGDRRRDEIRQAACRAVADRRRGSRAVMAGGVAIVPLTVVALLMFQLAAVSPSVTGNPGDSQRLATNEEGGERYREPIRMANAQFKVVRGHARPVQTVDDDELLALMERAGRPAGLVRVADEVLVVEHGSRPGNERAIGAGGA